MEGRRKRKGVVQGVRKRRRCIAWCIVGQFTGGMLCITGYEFEVMRG